MQTVYVTQNNVQSFVDQGLKMYTTFFNWRGIPYEQEVVITKRNDGLSYRCSNSWWQIWYPLYPVCHTDILFIGGQIVYTKNTPVQP